MTLYQNQEQDQKRIIIICKDERDWMNPETGRPHAEFNICDINMITAKYIPNLENSVIVLDDMGNKLKRDIANFFAEGRHDDIQMIVMCHKSAQIFNTARMSCDTIYITTYNGADQFKNFNEIYKCDH